jgi:hypothetical protein
MYQSSTQTPTTLKKTMWGFLGQAERLSIRPRAEDTEVAVPSIKGKSKRGCVFSPIPYALYYECLNTLFCAFSLCTIH